MTVNDNVMHVADPLCDTRTGRKFALGGHDPCCPGLGRAPRREFGGGSPRATPPQLSPLPDQCTPNLFSVFSKHSRPSDNTEVRGATLHAVQNLHTASDSPKT